MAANSPPNSSTTTQKINTGGQLGSCAFGCTGTSSVTGGPGGASNIAVTVRCAREGVRMTEAVEAPARAGTAAPRLIGVLLVGGAVSIAPGVYGNAHDPTHEHTRTLRNEFHRERAET